MQETRGEERLLSGYRFTEIGIRFCGSVSSSEKLGQLFRWARDDIRLSDGVDFANLLLGMGRSTRP